MNKEIRNLLAENHIIIKKITIKNNIRMIETDNEVLVIKKKEHDLGPLYKYLKSRSFDYFPEILYQTKNYDIYRYIEETPLQKEEKANDIMKLITLLHSKTTFYKEIDENSYKELYETTIDKIEYLINYYQDITELIEREEYMSPSSYLFIRNISKLFLALNYSKNQMEKWYQIISEKKRVRITQIHNNLKLEHYLLDQKPYLISWNKSKKDIPIYDLVNFYQKYYQTFDFCSLLHTYEMHYPMLKEEKILFFALISIPQKIDFNTNELELCQKIRNFYDYLFITDKLILDCLPKEEKRTG